MCCKVAVTGGSGFIGSHLVDRLVSNRIDTVVLDNRVSEEIGPYVKGGQISFIYGDVSDRELVKKFVQDAKTVIHLASILGTSETIERFDMADVVKTNLIGTINVLKAAAEIGEIKVIFPSTPDVPWINPYKITKVAGEKFCEMFRREFGVSVMILRLNNVYGPRERWYPVQKVVPTFILRALKDQPIPIYGDGSQSADYIYVLDTVNALIAACRKVEPIAEPISIGTGTSTSVRSLARKIVNLTKSSSKIVYLPMRKGETKIRIRVDPRKALESLGFRATVALDEGLKMTIPYYAQRI